MSDLMLAVGVIAAGILIGLLIISVRSGSGMRYHILANSQTYHCNSFELGDGRVNLSGCQGDYSYTIYNPVNVIVREGN